MLVSVTPQAKKIGRIHLPDDMKRIGERTRTGTIVAAGENKEGLKAGDLILFGRHVGQETEHDGRTLVAVQAKEILAVFE